MVCRYFKGPQNVFFVGPSRVPYLLPKLRLIQHDLPYFKAAFTSYFCEAAPSSMDLPDEDPEAFDLFVEWLFHGKVPPVPPVPYFEDS